MTVDAIPPPPMRPQPQSSLSNVAVFLAVVLACLALGRCIGQRSCEECPPAPPASSVRVVLPPEARQDLPDWYVERRLDAIEKRQHQIEMRLDGIKKAERYELDDYPDAEDEPPQRPWQQLREEKP